MPTPLAQWTLDKASQAVDTGLGLLLEKHQDKRQLKQQGKLLTQQMGFDKEMAEFNRLQQMKMWEDTNYSAQMKQLTKAGLNPGLIYGMGGAGGASTDANPGSVNSERAPSGGNEIATTVELGMRLQAQKAQIDVMASQAELNRAQAEKTAGVDTKSVQTQIESILQGIDNQRAQEELTRIQSKIATLDQQLKGQTLKDQIEIVARQLEILENQSEATFRANTITKATQDDVIQGIKKDVANKWLQATLMSTEAANFSQNTKLLLQDEKLREKMVNAFQNQQLREDYYQANDAERVRILKQITDFEIQDKPFLDMLREGFDGIFRGALSPGIPKGTTPPPMRGFKR